MDPEHQSDDAHSADETGRSEPDSDLVPDVETAAPDRVSTGGMAAEKSPPKAPRAPAKPRTTAATRAPRKSTAAPVSAIAQSRSRTAHATGTAVDDVPPPPIPDSAESQAEGVADEAPVVSTATTPTPRAPLKQAASKRAPAKRAPAKRTTSPKPASQAAALVAPTTVSGGPTADAPPSGETLAPADARTAGEAPTGPASAAPRRNAPRSSAPRSGTAPTTTSGSPPSPSKSPRPSTVRAKAATPAPEAPTAPAALVETVAPTVVPAEQTAVPQPVETAPSPDPGENPVERGERAATRIEDRPHDEAAVESEPASRELVLFVEGLSKSFDGVRAVDRIDLAVRTGSIFGIVGPNGAGKTTTLSMITGLLRPDAGRVLVHGADVWKNPVQAKRNMGVLPDRLRLFDRLTGGQLLYYSGSLRGLDRATVKSRSRDLAVAFGLEDALSRLVTDYSAGMTKKIALAAAMIHSPRLLILDEPFEAVDPVSAANVIEILQKYAAAGGTVVMSSHSMDLIQRICDAVAIIVRGEVLAAGTMEEVRGGASLEDRFVELAGGRKAAEGMEWLHSFSG